MEDPSARDAREPNPVKMMDGLEGDKLALTVLMMGTVPNNFSGPLPSFFTISSPFFHDQAAEYGNRKRIWQGLVMGSAVSLGEGFAVSVLADSWLPLIGTAAMVAIYGTGYIYSLNHPATEEEEPESYGLAA